MGREFLTQAEQNRIAESIREIEKQTSGEIVVMVVPDSGPYPMASLQWAAILALPLALLLTPISCAFFWLPPQNMWVFLSWFVVLSGLIRFGIHSAPSIHRRLISETDMDAQVHRAAQECFFREGIYRTRGETGVLIFISKFEHRVWIIADRGINAKIPKADWQTIVDTMISGIRQARAGEAVVDGVKEVGKRLAGHFPPLPEDRDELKNLIVQ